MDESDRLDEADLSPIFRAWGAHEFELALLNFLVGRTKIMSCFRRDGGRNVTMRDLVICHWIFTFRNEGGAGRREIVAGLSMPRATILDGIDRLERAGFVCRIEGRYYPSEKTGAIANECIEDVLERVGILCVAFKGYDRSRD